MKLARDLSDESFYITASSSTRTGGSRTAGFTTTEEVPTKATSSDARAKLIAERFSKVRSAAKRKMIGIKMAIFGSFMRGNVFK